jgi:hypothetical protein
MPRLKIGPFLLLLVRTELGAGWLKSKTVLHPVPRAPPRNEKSDKDRLIDKHPQMLEVGRSFNEVLKFKIFGVDNGGCVRRNNFDSE